MTPPDLGPEIHPASGYDRADDLWIITTYYNPARYATKRANYERFMAPIRAGGLPVVVVEMAVGDAPFEVPDGEGVLRVRSRDVMWQKERLLNLALDALPAECTKIAWLDCDITFGNRGWAVETSAKLDDFAVVQPYDAAIRLPRGETSYRGGDAIRFRGFCAVTSAAPELVRAGRYDRHGHTGFAWAARRDLLAAHGFYDTCIVGNGDHVMAHGFHADWESPCLRWMFSLRQLPHFAAWSRRISRDVAGALSFVRGACLHSWHGSNENRRYWDRAVALSQYEFDPVTDLRLDDDGCWAWASEKPELHRWARDYFDLRREDGAPECDDAGNAL